MLNKNLVNTGQKDGRNRDIWVGPRGGTYVRRHGWGGKLVKPVPPTAAQMRNRRELNAALAHLKQVQTQRAWNGRAAVGEWQAHDAMANAYHRKNDRTARLRRFNAVVKRQRRQLEAAKKNTRRLQRIKVRQF